MFGSKTNIDYQDIKDLIEVKEEREGQNLDFKELREPNSYKKEICRHISGFANASGGYLIFGVNKEYEIVGIEAKVGKSSVDEWVNDILLSGIEPKVYCHTPKIIKIPDSEKILLLVYVPESTEKPHLAKEFNTYYVRVYDKSIPANHYQIRDMFEISRNRLNEIDLFLDKRNLLDERNENFTNNNSSSSLFNQSFISQSKIPKLLISLITKFPNQEKVKTSFETFVENLLKINSLKISNQTFNLYHESHEVKIDGVIFKKYNRNYVEIHTDGYVEIGLSEGLFRKELNNSGEYNVISIMSLIGKLLQILKFSVDFYKLIDYQNEVKIQISTSNVANFYLIDFSNRNNDIKLEYQKYDSLYNKFHRNFIILDSFIPSELTDEKIGLIVNSLSQKIHRAFGMNKDFCFFEGRIEEVDFHLLQKSSI
jgi:ribosomal protein L33